MMSSGYKEAPIGHLLLFSGSLDYGMKGTTPLCVSPRTDRSASACGVEYTRVRWEEGESCERIVPLPGRTLESHLSAEASDLTYYLHMHCKSFVGNELQNKFILAPK